MVLNGDRDELGRYVRHVADLCGLRDWHLVIAHKPIEQSRDDTDHWDLAYCAVTYGRKKATIGFAEDWAAWSESDLRMVVTHELVHCHVEPMRWALNNVKSVTGPGIYEVISDAFSDAMELAVDAIATAWAETLPLPEIRATTKRKKAA